MDKWALIFILFNTESVDLKVDQALETYLFNSKEECENYLTDKHENWNGNRSTLTRDRYENLTTFGDTINGDYKWIIVCSETIDRDFLSDD